MKGLFEIINEEESENPEKLRRILADIPLEVDLDDGEKIDLDTIIYRVRLGCESDGKNNEYWEIYPDRYKTKTGETLLFTEEIYAIKHLPNGANTGNFTFVGAYSPVPPKLGMCLEFSLGGFNFGFCCKRLEENKTAEEDS